MGRPRLSAAEVKSIRRLHAKHKWSTRTIGDIFDVSSATVSKWLRCAHLPASGPGQGRKVSPEKRKAMRNRRAAVSKLARQTVEVGGKRYPSYPTAGAIQDRIAKKHGGVSAQTVRRDLKTLGFVCRRRPKVPACSVDHAAGRRQFCRAVKQHRLKGGNIIWSDEKRFTLNDFSSTTQWVRDNNDLCPLERTRWPEQVMVWAAFAKNGLKLLKVVNLPPREDGGQRGMNARQYIRRVLSPFIPQIRASGKYFMQDGASCHTAAATMTYLARKQVRVLPVAWPSKSPDLNPIEQVWSVLQRKVSLRRPQTVAEMTTYIKEEFAALPVDNFADHFDRQVRAVASVRGGWPVAGKKAGRPRRHF